MRMKTDKFYSPETNPSDHQITADGCAVAFASLPGGTAPYNLGRTLTHELGHWLNLFHTFQGGCSAENDSVEDTPAEQGPTYGCPATPVDTCTGPGFDGLDNTNNFMNYVSIAFGVEESNSANKEKG
jgi:hypothetical protein